MAGTERGGVGGGGGGGGGGGRRRRRRRRGGAGRGGGTGADTFLKAAVLNSLDSQQGLYQLVLLGV